MELKGTEGVKLEWKREDDFDRDYEAGPGYSFNASIPFELEYSLWYDDGEYSGDMHEEYLRAVAAGDTDISRKAWKAIRARHGAPGDAMPNWCVVLRTPLHEMAVDIQAGLTLDAAKAAALEDYKLRVAAAAAGFPLY